MEAARFQSECELKLLQIFCVEENASTALDQLEYHERYIAVIKRNAKRLSMEAFLRTLKKSNILLAEFGAELWNFCVESVKVHSEQQITFVFKDGMELYWSL